MLKLSRALLYFNTIRYLRPVQIYSRLWRHLYKPKPELKPPPRVRPVSGVWVQPAPKYRSLLGPSRFRFLNEEHDILAPQQWNNAARSDLWLYNLHYFDDLNAPDSDIRNQWHRALLIRWVKENPPGRGVGWEPYPTSLRLVNWIKWALAGNMKDGEGRNRLVGDLLHSLAVQARSLYSRIETHLLGNHLFSNAKALVFAGLFFEGKEANRWLAKGLEILRREVPEQVLPDGGHFERSPMYHSLILEDLLDLLNLGRAYGGRPGWPTYVPLGGWEEAAARMLTWLAIMCHPDGEIALFNDAAFGIAPSPAELADYARRLGFAPAPSPAKGVTLLPESGYARMENEDAVVLADVGPIGPDYLPGHGHADTLSFELSLFGRRVVVDTGTSRYDECPERLFQRGTKAHNTVEVDGEDSSEVWRSFRVARRARPFGLKVRKSDGVVTLECAHDGYRRLSGRVIHRRRWVLGARFVRVEDTLEGRFREAKARFLFHPLVAEVSKDLLGRGKAEKGGCLRLPGSAPLYWRVEGGEARVEPASYHPEFGMSLSTVRLVVPFSTPKLSLELAWGR